MKKLTNNDIDKWLAEDGKGIVRVDDYTDSHTKMMFQCHHGHLWATTIPSIKHGNGCSVCGGNYKPSKEEYNQSLIDDGRDVELVGEYLGNKTKSKFRCLLGHEWEASPGNIKSGKGCPRCSGKHKPTTEEFSDWLLNDGRGIEIIGEYKNAHYKTLFRGSCGHEWMMAPNKIKFGRGCPQCAEYGFNPNKPAWEYGFIRDGYLKIGITNHLEQRLKKHRRYGPIILVHQRRHEIGQMALDWENQIKKIHGGSFVTKEKCPDGYTETFPIHLAEILGINTDKPQV